MRSARRTGPIAGLQRLPSRRHAQSAGRLSSACRSSKARSIATATSSSATATDDAGGDRRSSATPRRACRRRPRSRATLRQARAADAARAHRPAARPRRAVPRADDARRLPHARRQGRLERRAAASIAGIGYVEGVRCVVSASERAIKGGTVAPSRPAQGPARAADRAREQAAVRAPGRIRRRQPAVPGRDLRAGRPRLRQPGAHVGARHPAGHRRARLVDRGRRLPAGPVATTSSWCAARPRCSSPARRCCKAATGEIATDEELGGAEMHATVSGVAEWTGRGRRRRHPHGARGDRQAGLERHSCRRAGDGPQGAAATTPTSCCGVVPPIAQDPYDMREVIARLVDGSDFLEFKAPATARRRSAARPRSRATPVGIISNNGPIDRRAAPARPRSSSSSAASSGTPIVYLQNTTGYMVGTRGRARRHRSSTAPR